MLLKQYLEVIPKHSSRMLIEECILTSQWYPRVTFYVYNVLNKV